MEDPDTLMSADTLQLIILPAGIIAVLFALYLARDVLSRDTGTKEMEDVAGTIFEGAVAFIRRQYTTIAILAVVGAFVIGAIITVFETKAVADTNTFGLDLIGERGSIHVTGLCKWGPSSLIVRDRVLPSGRPAEQVDTLEQRDPTWAIEYDHFRGLCARRDGTNIENDIWINDTLADLSRQALEGRP